MDNNIIPLKTARIKNTSSEWFDRENAEKLGTRDKLFKKFKSSRLNIDCEIYNRQETTYKEQSNRNKTVF